MPASASVHGQLGHAFRTGCDYTELNLYKKGDTPSNDNSGDAEKNAEIEKLKAELEASERKIAEADEKLMRSSMLETRMSSLSKKLTDITEERDSLMQINMKLSRENERLIRASSTTATDVESKSSTPAQSGVVSRSGAAPQQKQAGASPFATANPLASSTPKITTTENLIGSSSARAATSNVVPPAPSNQSQQQQQQQLQQPPPQQQQQQKQQQQQQQSAPSGFPTVPNEPMDMIPPVPSDSIPDPTPPTSSSNFGSSTNTLPVPSAFQSTTARVPTQSLFASSSSSSAVKDSSANNLELSKKTVLPNIDVQKTPQVTYSFATSTGIAQGQSLFGRSAKQQVQISAASTPASSENLALPEESVVEAAGQSSHVSGSHDGGPKESDMTGNDGESRDSSAVGGVSSSDGRGKKRTADGSGCDPKRLRESPSEAVTSSENQSRANIAEIPELDEEEENDLGLEQDISDEDPNETIRQRELVPLDNDEEVLEEDIDEQEDDESFGNDEDYQEQSDDQEDTMDEPERPENGQDPSLDDQDREAASAMEEAEDEGRDPLGSSDEPAAPADPTGAAGVGSSGESQQDVPRVRMPTGMVERDDQCSSSNETAEGPSGSGQRALSGRNQARLNRPQRGKPPSRGIYVPRRRGDS
ncbi:unnamed protein product [Caenorhabditis bovis]|uniref:Uncharacterized protein n=1 Tax=Caenorhabditis bovis TaxID=2654633 RepID=A0A8S1FER3_9PELO|nr:unnamed protein product [Caenorhabditis bovis]